MEENVTVEEKELRIKRGDIIIANLSSNICESIQSGERPCIVVSNKLANHFSPIIHVVPLTSKEDKRHIPTHKTIFPWRDVIGELKEPSTAICENLLPIYKRNVLRKTGARVDEKTMERILDGILIQLGIVEV